MTASRKKPTHGHKLMRVQVWRQATCECGWQSNMWGSSGAQQNALSEWEAHKRQCIAANRDQELCEICDGWGGVDGRSHCPACNDQKAKQDEMDREQCCELKTGGDRA